MKKAFSKNSITVFFISAVVFFITTVIANKYLSVYNVTSVRVSAMLNPVLGIVFGWPAIFGCAVGNFVSDLVSGWGIVTALMGFPSQILYGFFPFYLWRKYIGCKSHLTRLDSPKKVLVFILLTLANSVYIGLDVGLIQFIAAGNEFWTSSFFAFLNDFSATVFLGIPALAIFDFIYSSVIHSGRRRLSVNEIIIIATSVIELVIFAAVATLLNILFKSLTTVELWTIIFLYSMFVFGIGTVVSLAVMSVFSIIRRKHAGLRIIEKPNGMVFVDEKRRLEFVSMPAQDKRYRVKADSCGYTLEDAQKNMATSYEEAWYCDLSSQKGCQMKCLFCDCPGYGYYGNASRDDLKYQIKTILENTGPTHTKYFAVDFMRMGEPTLNPELLSFIELDLKNEIGSRVAADVIVPGLSTMMPKNKPNVTPFLKNYCRIKNEVYNGNAELQFSICTTDEAERQRIFKGMAMSLEEIAKVCEALPTPKGSKYRLNFPVTSETKVDANLIDRLFDKSKFAVKLTPIHNTFNAKDNDFKITSEYNSYDVFEPIEKSFLVLGWDVFVYLDKINEDKDSLTCGNLLISNIREKLSDNISKKKRVGLVVAIEMQAIFDMYKNCKQLESPQGIKLFLVERENYSIYVAQSGMGECAASAACQFLISKCNVSKIINFGVVGGLTADMSKLTVCLVEKVVHYKYDCSEFLPVKVGQVDGYDGIFMKTNENLVKNAKMMNGDLQLVTCCSGDKFVGTAEEKTYLHETFKGDICDMESAGIVLTCDANKVPCILFKAVSDGLSDGAEGFFAELDNASKKCLKIADKILDYIANIE